MCGICGIIGDPDAKALARMLATLRHRGPDDEGTYLGDGVALGHRRLSIIDLPGGHQPMTNEDGSLHLVYNGEIYNHRELRAELETRGHRFATHCDTEVLVHLYEEHGAACVERLNGMFAFGVWDDRRRQLFLARDRVGIKPLFYARAGDSFLFASELKAILAHPAVSRGLDPVALEQYLTFMFVPAPRTIIRGVAKLAPGRHLTLEGQRERVTRYWSLPSPGEAGGRGDAAEELRAHLAASVKLRLMSDVPLGGYLSGGLDSSVICALMARAAEGPVHTFSVGFAERGYDERRHARLVAEALGTEHNELMAGGDALAELPRIIWHLDEPVADAAAIPTWLMARATKPHATVVLTGEGADELFAGYPYYKALVWAERFGVAARALPGAGPELLRRAAALGRALPDRAAAYLALKSVFTGDERRELGLSVSTDDAVGEIVRPFFGRQKGEDFLSQLLRFEVSFWLPDDLLTKVDRMTMAHAVEARVPYLDHRVVAFAMGLHSAQKLRGVVGKRVLRQAARGLAPAVVGRRAKAGFRVPVAEWARGAAGASLRELFSPAAVRARGLFRPEALYDFAAGRVQGAFARRKFWTLAVLELWCREFLDRNPADRP